MSKDYVDPRVIRTRQLFGAALIRAATERGFENLTIQAVVDEAQLGYASFHRHYRSLDELLASIVTPAWETLHQRIAEQDTLYDESLALFQFILEYQDIYRIYLSLPRSSPVRQPIDEAALALLTARYERQNDTKVPFELSLMAVEALTGRLIRLYLDNIHKYSPKEMADMHLDFVLKSALNTLQLRQGVVLAPQSLVPEGDAS